MNHLCIVVHFQLVIKLLQKGVRVHHRRVILMQKMQNFSGEGAHHLPRLLPRWVGGHPLPIHYPLGASILTPPILKFCLRYCQDSGKKMATISVHSLKKRAQMNPPVTTFAALLDEVVQNALPNFINESAEILPLWQSYSCCSARFNETKSGFPLKHQDKKWVLFSTRDTKKSGPILVPFRASNNKVDNNNYNIWAQDADEHTRNTNCSSCNCKNT